MKVEVYPDPIDRLPQDVFKVKFDPMNLDNVIVVSDNQSISFSRDYIPEIIQALEVAHKLTEEK